MATIEKRGQFWRVKIRRAGLMAQTKTFDNRTHAQQWARSVESDLDKGIVVDRRTAQRLSLAEVLERYRREVTPTKRGSLDENLRLKAMAQRPFARIKMSALTSSHLAAYRDERLKIVSGATVNREFSVLSHAIDTARREWVSPDQSLHARTPATAGTPAGPAPPGRRGTAAARRVPRRPQQMARAFRGACHRNRHAAGRAPGTIVGQRGPRAAHGLLACHQEWRVARRAALEPRGRSTSWPACCLQRTRFWRAHPVSPQA